MSIVNNHELDTGDQEAYITLKVKNQVGMNEVSNGIEVYFRIKRSTMLKNLMIAYCNRQSVVFNATIFLFNGRCVRGSQTPDTLHMNEGDRMDAIPRQMEEQRLYIDRLTLQNEEQRLYIDHLRARNIALEEKLTSLRKYKKKDGVNIKVGRLVSQLIVNNGALKEELTRLGKDEEEDVASIKIGRLILEGIEENIALKEKVRKLWNGTDEEDDEDEDENEDAAFIELGRIVSGLLLDKA